MLTKTDKFIIAVCIFAICLLSLPFFSQTIYDYVFNDSGQNSDEPVVAEVVNIKNDARFKNSVSYVWQNAKTSQQIRLGDTMYTGDDSESDIAFLDGGKLKMLPNSLIKFTQINEIQIPNLAEGNFKIAVDGEMKISLGGKIIELSGKNSEVTIAVAENNKAEIKLIKGQVEVNNNKQKKLIQNTNDNLQVSLSSDRISTQFVIPITPKPAPEVSAVKDSQDPSIAQPIQTAQAPADPQSLHYDIKFDDLYLLVGNKIIPRQEMKGYVNHTIKLTLPNATSSKSLYVKIAKTANFETHSTQTVPLNANAEIPISQVYLGENYFQTSSDQINWSPTSKFNVSFSTSNKPAPSLEFKTEKIDTGKLENTYTINFQVKPKSDHNQFQDFLLEISRSKEFTSGQSEFHKINQSGIQFALNQPQLLYLRVRGIGEKGDLTNFSETKSFQLFEKDFTKPIMILPSLAEAKALKKKRQLGSVKKQNSVEQSDLRKPSQESTETPLQTQTQSQAMATSSQPSSSSENQMVMKEQPFIRDTNNYMFDSSKLMLQGTLLTLFSIDQIDLDNPPVASNANLTGTFWFDSHGLELSAQTKVANSESGQTAKLAPFRAEAKYQYRWRPNANFFSRLKRSQISLIVGYEHYRNPGQEIYSEKYNLIKSGIGLLFPAWSSFDTGGEILYGIGTDQSRKYEISGFFSYYLRMNWSLGFGYKVHIFDAGSDETASSLGVPYREGGVEGTTNLRYHY